MRAQGQYIMCLVTMGKPKKQSIMSCHGGFPCHLGDLQKTLKKVEVQNFAKNLVAEWGLKHFKDKIFKHFKAFQPLSLKCFMLFQKIMSI